MLIQQLEVYHSFIIRTLSFCHVDKLRERFMEGARANGYTADELYIIGVESSAPYPVTVLKLTDDMIELGRKTYRLWLEKLRVCLDSDVWPGYTRTIVDFAAPAWMADDDDA